MAKITACSVKGSGYYTDEWRSYNDLKHYGKHRPIDHGKEFRKGRAHINGTEGFWSFAKQLHAKTRDVDKGNFPFYFQELRVPLQPT